MLNAEQKLKVTPLNELHVKLGARMVPFTGWSMPVQYAGIIEEHLWTRKKAGLFDICHMGEFLIKGPGAAGFADRLVTQRIVSLEKGKCRYGFLLKENGGVIDDLIVFKISEEEYMLVVNSGTLEKDKVWIKNNLIKGSEFRDISDETAKIDLQGPLSPAVIGSLPGFSGARTIKRFNFAELAWEGVKIIVSATGYTGELGYEIFLPFKKAGKLWSMLLERPEVKPAGLGARDSLRLEMGYPLYGHDIDEEHTPLEAGLSRFVDMDKEFIGRKALLEQLERGFKRVLAGFVCEGRRSAKQDFVVMCGDKEAGKVTSGAFSPCLKKGIGLCYIEKDLAAEGKDITLTDGKIEIKANVKKPPFISKD
jgi:aminomethyltransferase